MEDSRLARQGSGGKAEARQQQSEARQWRQGCREREESTLWERERKESTLCSGSKCRQQREREEVAELERKAAPALIERESIWAAVA